MTIDRYNYEEFFLLYTDNELNPAERAAVEAFAAANPDLGEELEQLQQFKMEPEEIGYPGISSLIRPEAAGSIADEAGSEEKFLLYIDNELDAREKEAVEKFVQEHPAVEPLFNLLKSTVLQPDEKIQFPDKQLLYRTEKEKVVPFGWWRVAAAAMVLLVAGALWLNNRPAVPSRAVVAQADKKPIPVTAPSGKAAGQQAATGTGLPDSSSEIEAAPEKRVVPEQVASLGRNTRQASAGSSSIVRERSAAARRVQHLAATVEEADPLQATSLASQNKISPAAVTMQKNIIDEAVSLNTHTEVADDEADSGVSFASNNDAEDVWVSNIPVDKKHALRGLFRKASRVLNKAAGLHGEKSILIGSVELALK